MAADLPVTAHSPKANETAVPLNALVSATFDTPLLPGDLNASTFVVYGEKAGRISGDVSYDAATRTATFQPLKPFLPGDRISVTLTRGILGDTTPSTTNGFVWNFDTQVLQGAANLTATTVNLGNELTAVCSADFNRDGSSDLAIASYKTLTNSIQLYYYENGVLKPGSSVNLPLDQAFYSVKPLYAGDLNGDEIPDLLLIYQRRNALTSAQKKSLFSIYYVLPDGSFLAGPTFDVGKTNTEIRSAVIADMNADGFLDIVILRRLETSSDDRTIMIFLNDGNGHFGVNGGPNNSLWNNPSNPANTECLIARDLNLDGYLDLIATLQGSNGGIFLFMNEGDGELYSDPPEALSIASDFESAFSNDVTGDLLPDITAADLGSNKVFIYRHNGVTNGLPTFAAPQSFPAANTPFAVQYGDLDTDSDLDLATVGSHNGNFVVSTNDGTGDFSQTTNYTVSASARMFSIGDLNKDAALDYAIVDATGVATILLNDVNGNLPPERPVLNSPANHAFINSLNAALRWSVPADANGDPLHFRVTLTEIKDGSEVTTVYDSNLTPELFSPTPPVAQGSGTVTLNISLPRENRYKWEVAAWDGKCYGVGSEIWDFIVDATPPSNLSIALPGAAYNGHWFDPPAATDIEVQLTYTEQNAESATLTTVGLGGPYVQSEIPSGTDQQVIFSVDPDGVADGQYDIQAKVKDQATNEGTASSWIGIDKNPPSATTAQATNDTSSSTAFALTWGGGTDGAGSGLSGLYSVQVSINGGPWSIWLDKTTATDTVYQGSQLSSYAFEAAAYDNLGHFEEFANVAEATVLVDTTIDDTTPPGKPQNLRANGNNPSDWQTGDEFNIEWELPFDESGISASYWKLGSPPTSNQDYGGTEGPQGPFTARLTQDGAVNLYLWLQDGKGNVDYHNWASVLLRKDSTAPTVHRIVLEQPSPPYTDNLGQFWYNRNVTPQFSARVVYSEPHARSAELSTSDLTGVLVDMTVPSGEQVETSFVVDASDGTDKIYALTGTVDDSAANQSGQTIQMGLDGASPSGCIASAPPISDKLSFLVSWSSGTDGSGSGLSGLYDVYVKIDQQAWAAWLVGTSTQENTFTGLHGHRYQFEAITKDHVGNLEPLLGIAEASVEVDTTADDITPPAAPINLMAGGSAPYSPWQTTSAFQIDWQNPDDESGVVRSLWKLGQAPVANFDTTGSGPGTGPMTVSLVQEGRLWLYVWLVDKQNNVDYHNYSRVMLRYDAHVPVVHAIEHASPPPAFVDGENRSWYNQGLVADLTYRIRYSETFPTAMELQQPGLAPTQSKPVPPGENAAVFFTQSIETAADGRYTLTASLQDSAGQSGSLNSLLGLDKTPPTGAVANGPDTSLTLSFTITWSSGQDADGSGTNGKYNVLYQDNGGAWTPWIANFQGNSNMFTLGVQGHRYGFEALAQDQCGNLEVATQVAEKVVLVDTLAGDKTPPPPPINLTAGGSNPSPWQTAPSFVVRWQVPQDESGIAKSLWKLGSAPVSLFDATGTGPGAGPLEVVLAGEGSVPLYVWLQDGKGNVDHRNNSSVLLRYDAASPAIAQAKFVSTTAPYVDSTGRTWFNQTTTKEVSVQVIYTESQPKSVVLQRGSLGPDLVQSSPPGGTNVTATFVLPLADAADGTYSLIAKVIDVADKMDSTTLLLGLDSTPPTGAFAVGPDTSSAPLFNVHWSTGEDQGSGLSGRYRLYVQDNGAAWQVWLEETTELSATFSGVHAHTYGFEAVTWDRLGNAEPRQNVPETKVIVDTTLDDTQAPAPPIRLQAGGSNPSPWQKEALFSVTWELPFDESGIEKAFYKLGDPPASNSDYAGITGPNGPLPVLVEQEGITRLYVWLADGKGNVDFKENASVQLRHDKTLPQISSFVLTDPAYGAEWYNQIRMDRAHAKLTYSEIHPDSVIIHCESLGLRFVEKNPTAGQDKELTVSIPISSAKDGSHEVWAAMVDSAGNTQTKSLLLKLDSTPPVRTRAASPDTSAEIKFVVTWSGATDSMGVGISGKYNVRYKEGGGNWRNWLVEYLGESAEFPYGKNGVRFQFEAAAWDHLNNREKYSGLAETSTFVDTTADDVSAPPPPVNLLADGSSPSPWKNSSTFTATWQVPYDQSGVSGGFYKVGQAPTSNADYSGTCESTGPLTVKATEEQGQWLYLWLRDGRGNANYQNSAKVLLRYDKSSPEILGKTFTNAGYSPDWFDPNKERSANWMLSYRERHADLLTLKCESLGLEFVNPNPRSGLSVSDTASITIAGHADGEYILNIALSDSAGNATAILDTLHLDSTAPDSAVASAPDTSSTRTFSVAWSAGEDGLGVGVSGRYDVNVKVDSSSWTKWLDQFAGSTASYQGQHGHRYLFEAAAYDLLGHREPLRGVAEATVVVDTTSSDFSAPAAPLQLSAGGANPSPWQKTASFKVSWLNPPDVSAIRKSWYKLGTPPFNPTDTTHSAAGIPPISVDAAAQDGQWLYLWLEDGRGNADHKNWSAVLLRWDATIPKIDSLVLKDPMFAGRWFNPTTMDGTELKAYYTEKHRQNVSLTADSLQPAPASTAAADTDGVATFTLLFPDTANATYTLRVTVTDSAGNSAIDSCLLSLDSVPPSGTLAHSPDTTGVGEFLVSWHSNPTDGIGSGISGIYDVRIRIDDGAWQPWKSRTHDTEGKYTGEAGHRYSFEAAAYDNVGNREEFAGQQESSTFVDADFSDTAAPAAPQQLTANGASPSPWSNHSEFILTWENPVDPSGIARCRYKIGSRPTASDDTTGNGPGIPPIKVIFDQEEKKYLYLWLEDGRQNSNFANLDSVLLRYDASAPVIDSVWVANAAFAGKWLNPDSSTQARIRMTYSDSHPDSARLHTGSLQGEIAVAELQPGVQRQVDFTLPITDLVDGCYQIGCSLSDSAGNSTTDTLLLCIDGAPPAGATASSPETSRNGEFVISWAGTNQGNDGSGSGLSGKYDVRIRVDQGQWHTLLQREAKLSSSYVGVHGHSYSFEVAAWDNVGNREPFLGQAESTTRVDTAFVDTTAPAAPVQILAGGGNPSPWQDSTRFEISWENPIDPSGIVRAFYKLGAAPQANDDTTGSAPANGRLLVHASSEYGQMLFLWLADGKGNLDYRQHAGVLLRYDGTKPDIDSVVVRDPAFGKNWYNQKKTGKIPLRVYYSEKYPKVMSLSHPLLPETTVATGLPDGEHVFADAELQVLGVADGGYRIRTTISDSAGNLSAPDSFEINLDSTPPRISHQSDTSAVKEGQPHEVRALVYDQNRIENVSLQYWLGGSRFKTTQTMSKVDDSTFTATIPGNSIGARGVEYAIFAGDGISLNREPLATARPSAFVLRVQVTGADQKGMIKPTTLVYGAEANAYRMLSLPLQVVDPSPAAVLEDNLGAYDPKRWKFFYWNTIEDRYDEYPSTGDLLPGRAFWLITSLPNISLDTGPGVSVNSAEPFIVPLRRGWNDIGIPFNFDIEWQDILLASAADTQKIIGPYTYVGRWLLPPEVTILKPWEGYSFYTEFDDISLAIPALEARKGLRKPDLMPSYEHADWVATLEARQDNSADLANFIGSIEGATPFWDYGLDFVEPPVVGTYISLYFPHENWQMKAKEFSSDFRPSGAGDHWEFTVRSNNPDDKEATILFRRIVKPAAEMQFTLVDMDAKISVDLQLDSTYSFWFSRSGLARHFKLYAGSQEYMEQHKNDLPGRASEFMLVQNYPNPFNSATIISYELKQDTEVHLAIYNLLAQRVKLLYAGRQQQGFHQFRWDAHEENGQELGTGIYILRLETPEYTSTRKMVFMR